MAPKSASCDLLIKVASFMLNYAKILLAGVRGRERLGLDRVLCPRCTKVVDRDVLSPGERVFWCRHCSAVREIPVFRIPGWIAGVLVVLLLRLPLI
jgi:hypothetical protein